MYYYNPKRKHVYKNILCTRIGETLTMKEGSEWRTPKSKKNMDKNIPSPSHHRADDFV